MLRIDAVARSRLRVPSTNRSPPPVGTGLPLTPWQREDAHQVVGLPVKDSSPPVRRVSQATGGGIDYVADWVSPATARRRFASITGDVGW